jgi:hypothetical protein
MSVTDFKNFAEQAKRTDQDLWLGELVWYTVPETRVRHTDLEVALTKAGLSNFVPRKPRDEDVFRRVAPNGHKKRVGTADPEIHINYLIRQVKRGGGVCVKQIVAETVDSGGEKLGYEPVYEMKYVEGATEELTAFSLSTTPDPVAQGIANDVLLNYAVNRGWVDAQAVRTIIRKVMEAARATNVRQTGGVYFVMSAYTNLVTALEKFAPLIPGCQVESLPLIADDKRKALIRRAYEAESVEQIDKMLAEVSGILGDPDAKLDARKYAAYSAQFSAALGKTKDYENLLSDTLDTTNSKLLILQRSMSQLLMRTVA